MLTKGRTAGVVFVGLASCQLLLDASGAPATGPAPDGGVEGAIRDSPDAALTLDALPESGAVCAPRATTPCTDTTSDPHHCGACGHDCLGGGCDAGACLPVVLASGVTDPSAIVVQPTPCGAGNVVWLADGCPSVGGPARLSFAAKDGTGAHDVASPACVLDLRANAAQIVIAAYTTVQLAAWDGGSSGLVASGGGMYRAALAGPYAYWAGPYSTGIGRHRLDAPACSADCAAFDVGDPVFDMVGNADQLYFALQPADSGTTGSVRRLLDDGGSDILASDQVAPAALAVAAGWVFWSAGGFVWRAALDGKGAAPIVDDTANAITSDGVSLFWTRGEADGDVRTSGLDGKNVRTVATGQGHPWAIAVDDVAIYWVDRGSSREASDGRVMRIAR